MKITDLLEDDVNPTRRGFLGTMAAGAAGLAGLAPDDSQAKSTDKPHAKPQAIPKSDVSTQDKAKGTIGPQNYTPSFLYGLLLSTARENGITNPVELSQLMAQVDHETGHFKKFGEEKPRDQVIKHYRHVMGNRGAGDAEKYTGRGYIQLTGRDNYELASKNVLGDRRTLIHEPSMASNPVVAADIAIWYWKNYVQNQVKNFSDTAAVTRAINGKHAKPETIAYRDKLFKDFFYPRLSGTQVATK